MHGRGQSFATGTTRSTASLRKGRSVANPSDKIQRTTLPIPDDLIAPEKRLRLAVARH